MKSKNILLLFCFLLCSLSYAQTVKLSTSKPENEPVPQVVNVNSQLSYKITNTANHTFCYDIFCDGKKAIHQMSIPGLPGNEGFKTKSNAEAVALLVISKIQRGEMPPSVSIDELKKMKVISVK